MKTLIVGETGTIGSAVLKAFTDAGHEVVGVSRNSHPRVDISLPGSIRDLYSLLGTLDAVICCAGDSVFGPLSRLTDEDFALTISQKVMGQINLVRLGVDHVSDNGVFVLTAGGLGTVGMPNSSAAGMANLAIEGFVRCASNDLPRGIRITAVKPPYITESALKYGIATEGTLSAADNARAYVAMATGNENGVAVRSRDFAPQ